MLRLSPTKGKLLIAEPSIGDQLFERTVVLLTEHNKEGSVGFILNKPLNMKVRDLIHDLNCDLEVYNGGPVEQDSLYFIHQSPEVVPNSIEISKGIYWGGDFSIIKELINNKKIDINTIRFFLGYSGWTPEQLKNEMNENSWIISKELSSPNILDYESNNMWKKQMNILGGKYKIWANAPIDPSLN